MFMMASRTLLKACAATSASPSSVLKQVNAMLAEDNDAMTFVTLLYGIYDPSTKELVYSNGGHNPPVIVKPDLSIELLEATGGIALGVTEEFEYRENTVALESGSMIVFYTDGVSEAEKSDSELFEMDRFCQIFREGTFGDAKEVTDTVFSSVRKFVGDSPQSDDITCLVLRVT